MWGSLPGGLPLPASAAASAAAAAAAARHLHRSRCPLVMMPAAARLLLPPRARPLAVCLALLVAGGWWGASNPFTTSVVVVEAKKIPRGKPHPPPPEEYFVEVRSRLSHWPPANFTGWFPHRPPVSALFAVVVSMVCCCGIQNQPEDSRVLVLNASSLDQAVAGHRLLAVDFCAFYAASRPLPGAANVAAAAGLLLFFCLSSAPDRRMLHNDWSADLALLLCVTCCCADDGLQTRRGAATASACRRTGPRRAESSGSSTQTWRSPRYVAVAVRQAHSLCAAAGATRWASRHDRQGSSLSAYSLRLRAAQPLSSFLSPAYGTRWT